MMGESMGYGIDRPPYEVTGSDGTVTFDGETVTIHKRGGEQKARLRDIETVELRAAGVLARGDIRFTMTDATRTRIRFPRSREPAFTGLVDVIRTSLY